MKIIKIRYLALLIIFICSCTSNTEKYNERKNAALQEYQLRVSNDAKLLVDSFFRGELTTEANVDLKEIKGGFLCMWKQRDIEIYPHLALNTLFKEHGYKVTYSPDSLKYIIISETISHSVGSYTNGADAAKLETIISVLDIESKKAYKFASNMGGSPPSKTPNSTVALGSFWDDEDIFNNLKHRIIK